MAAHSHTKPSIFDYLDYRRFLEDFTAYLKSKGQYSIRKFAAQAGFKSNSFMRMVVTGKRNLSTESVRKLSTAFRLTERETEFFEKLVIFAQSETLQGKDTAYQEILKSKAFQNVQPTAAAQYEFFNNWSIVALLEGLGTTFSDLPPQDMARALDMTQSQLEQALNLLNNLGLIHKRGKVWKKKEAAFQTPAETNSLNIRNFHRQMIERALHSIDNTPREKRAFRSGTIALSHASYEDVKRRTFQFIEDLNAIYAREKDVDKIYQINIQIFPLLEVPGSGELSANRQKKQGDS